MKETSHKLPYYPVFLKIAEKKCVVAGGGNVALRKVRVLLDHGASVTVISPDHCPELLELDETGRIQIVKRNFQKDDLHDAFIAVAATDDRIANRLVAEMAQDNAVPVNIADDAENSDFILPAYMRRGDITIAVSTAGTSPALARKLRTKLENEYGEEYGVLLIIIDKLRAEIKNSRLNIDSEKWQDALDLDTLIPLLKKGNSKDAEIHLRKKLDIP
jgi:precorrin-2 dehydrogenase/sirohydrochlorin ferrochelatase